MLIEQMTILLKKEEEIIDLYTQYNKVYASA